MKNSKNSKEISDIVERLIIAKDAYYNDEAIMSDAEFDALEERLQALDPDNDYFKIVGAKNNKLKIQHAIPMLSAGKAKTVNDVMDWVEKIKVSGLPLCVEPKIDGLSATMKYKNGTLEYIATRGDGAIGQDISHIRDYAQGIVSRINDTTELEVRGELFIPKQTCPNPDNKPLRNIAVGFINRKETGLQDLKYVKFVAYQIAGKSFSSETDKFEWLKENRFNHVVFFVISTHQELDKLYSDYLNSFRDKWEYETDGLIITVNDNSIHDSIDNNYEVSHHHHYNIAFKPPAEAKETTLNGIEWNVSRLGKVTPVALVEPVILGSSRVSRCTLNNYENVKNNKLHKGDIVLVERANDVIPFFKENLSKHESTEISLIPDQCPSCNSELVNEGVHLVCKNKDCREQQILKIVYWVVNCGMESFSEASVRVLFEAQKIKKIKDLYTLKPSDFDGIAGFGERKVSNALEQIEQTKKMTIAQFVDRLGIDLVGEKAVKKLGIRSAEELLAFQDITYVIGQNLVKFVKENRQYIDELLEVVVIQEETKKTSDSKVVCMTGSGPKKRDDLIKEIEAKGDTFSDSISKTTNILICEDTNGTSSKLLKARKMGITLMNYSEYFRPVQ